MLIYAFCKSCEPEAEHEIVFVTEVKQKKFQVQVRNSYKTGK